MKFLAFLLPSLFALSAFFTACGKIDLPSTDDEKTDTTSTDTIDNDSPDVVPAGTDTLTVAEAQNETTGDYVLVKGYIVGYLAGNSTSACYFELPTVEANTNMLLADSPDETDVNNCIPVRLEKGKSGNFRENLNLYDHPENYKRCIAVYACVETYFSVKGIKTIVAYSWCSTDNTSSDDADDPDDTDDPDVPDTPDDNDAPDTPTIDPTPADSLDGR